MQRQSEFQETVLGHARAENYQYHKPTNQSMGYAKTFRWLTLGLV